MNHWTLKSVITHPLEEKNGDANNTWVRGQFFCLKPGASDTGGYDVTCEKFYRWPVDFQWVVIIADTVILNVDFVAYTSIQYSENGIKGW